MFSGSLVALITPMTPDGAMAEDAYARLIEWQIDEGTQGLVPVGTTGESPTLSHVEHKRAVEIAVEVARGRVPVIAGAGSNSTAEAIDLARHAGPAGGPGARGGGPVLNKPPHGGGVGGGGRGGGGAQPPPGALLPRPPPRQGRVPRPRWW
jgi:4-hydroxy-tetrahydrodipicolinate synthase